MPSILKSPIIGIAGRARSGKNSVYQILARLAGESHLQKYNYAFADPIKRMLEEGLEISMDESQDKEKIIPVFGVSRRELMVTLGTNWGRNMINNDIWTILATVALHRMGPGMIISDIRFENEADWVRSKGGVIIHILKDGLPPPTDESEMGIRILPQDFVVNNNGTMDELFSEVENLVNGNET